MANAPMVSAVPDPAALKTRQQATWASGDYVVIGTTLQIVEETLCEVVDLRSGECVLDLPRSSTEAAAPDWACRPSTLRSWYGLRSVRESALHGGGHPMNSIVITP